jgi:hypothetical protein
MLKYWLSLLEVLAIASLRSIYTSANATLWGSVDGYYLWWLSKSKSNLVGPCRPNVRLCPSCTHAVGNIVEKWKYLSRIRNLPNSLAKVLPSLLTKMWSSKMYVSCLTFLYVEMKLSIQIHNETIGFHHLHLVSFIQIQVHTLLRPVAGVPSLSAPSASPS